jgi:phage shock protein A
VRFEQMERRLDTAEGEVEAFDLGRGRTLADEIEELAADSVVEEELRALKSKLGRGDAPSGEA